MKAFNEWCGLTRQVATSVLLGAVVAIVCLIILPLVVAVTGFIGVVCLCGLVLDLFKAGDHA